MPKLLHINSILPVYTCSERSCSKGSSKKRKFLETFVKTCASRGESTRTVHGERVGVGPDRISVPRWAIATFRSTSWTEGCRLWKSDCVHLQICSLFTDCSWRGSARHCRHTSSSWPLATAAATAEPVVFCEQQTRSSSLNTCSHARRLATGLFVQSVECRQPVRITRECISLELHPVISIRRGHANTVHVRSRLVTVSQSTVGPSSITITHFRPPITVGMSDQDQPGWRTVSLSNSSAQKKTYNKSCVDAVL